jgi:putative protease
MRKIELLAPAGDKEKLLAAIHFGADAIYFAGKKYGLRAFADNFDHDEIKEAIELCHAHNVKTYITVNVLAHNRDFEELKDYLMYLEACHVDGVIVNDLGVATYVKKYTSLDLHVSTQANVTNKESALVWVSLGAKRLVLARELSLKEIREIKDAVGEDIEIETFVHGAMCVSYSGRCLLSNYLTNRDSNSGACSQPCRWEYQIYRKHLDDENGDYLPIEEDERGTYILNSKDLCLINHLKELMDAGITSFKVEGRMKSCYYVATVINAYRRAIDNIINEKEDNFDYVTELEKTSNRSFAEGFYFDKDPKINLVSSKYQTSHDFIATVIEDSKDGYVLVEQRNKFSIGDELEVLSTTDSFNKIIKVEEIKDLAGNHLSEAKRVQENVYIKTNLVLLKGDMLRRKIR